MTKVVLRFSEEMIKRLNDACEKEGIDKSTLVVSYMYYIVKQVKMGKTPEIDLKYHKLDQNRDKHIAVRVSNQLKTNFNKALDLLNKNKLTQEKLTLSKVLISYLIKFIIESETLENE